MPWRRLTRMEKLCIRQTWRAWKMELDELNDEMKLGLSNCERRTFCHGSYSVCLSSRQVFELKQVSISGISGESEPSPARLRGIVQRVRQEGATHIFFETLASPGSK